MNEMRRLSDSLADSLSLTKKGSRCDAPREVSEDGNGGVSDSSTTIEACFDTLSSLLKGGGNQTLTQKHLDAIKQLKNVEAMRALKSSISSAGSGVSDSSSQDRWTVAADDFKDTMKANFQKLPTGSRIRSKIRESVRESRRSHRRESMISGFQACRGDEMSSNAMREVMDAYGGRSLRQVMEMDDDVGDLPVPNSRRQAFLMKKPNRVSDRRDWSLLHEQMDQEQCKMRSFMAEHRGSNFSVRRSIGREDPEEHYCPGEWRNASPEVQKKLFHLLSYESLSKWDFDVVKVNELIGAPLLLVGWAILCAPMAQNAMRFSLQSSGNYENLRVEDTDPYYYEFDHLKIDPRSVCNFLREVERRYEVTAYHNNIHAADVTQSLHCLFQLMDEKSIARICNPIAIFSILLAATFHDVGHPGTNNLYQKNAVTQFAIQSNDVSILESMHSAVGHSLLMGSDKQPLWDIFREWSKEDKAFARSIMVSSVMGTDMSNHFAKLEKLDSLMERVEDDFEGTDQPILSILAETLSNPNAFKDGSEGEESTHKEDCSELADLFIKFLLHAADISNPAKVKDTALYWTECALTEFFDQGDIEKKEGLPVSPLCDRYTVTKPDSQIGFIKFIVIPTFELLGEMIPRVKDEIMPILMENLEYWNKEKTKSGMKNVASLDSVAEE